MALRLPPLNALRMFEAAGRLLSFKDAAEELRITPSAVSHAIQGLEDWLGARLFARTGRGLVLTDAGAAYLPYVRDALVLLARGTESVPGRVSKGALSVSVAPTFAARWLVPNLPRFRAAHPEFEVSIDTSYRQVQFPVDGVDMAIRMGKHPPPGLYAIKLATEILSPVCAPNYKDLPRLKHPQDLARTTLVHVTTVTEDWAAWAETAGIRLDLGKGLKCDTIYLAMESAAQGIGVALGRRPLIDGDLRAGRLIQIFPEIRRHSTSYWLVCAEESVARREVTAFRDWLLSSFAAPGAP